MEKKELNEMTHMEAIRLLSGAINPELAVDILAFINLIARNSVGDAEDDFTDEQIEKYFGIKIKREVK